MRAGSPAPSTAGIALRPLLPLASLAVVYVVWGSTYLAIRVAVETIPPLLMAGVRFLAAGSILYLVSVGVGDRRGDRPTARQWRSAAIIGGLLLLGGNALVGVGETRIPSGAAALLVATVPFWFAALDRLATGARVRPAAVAGMLLGFAGAVVLVHPTSASHLDVVGVLVVLAATVGWSAGSLYSRSAVLPHRSLVAGGMEMLAGGALCVVAGLAAGEWRDLHLASLSTRSLTAFVYLVMAGSLLAYTAYRHALRTLPTATVSTYAYVNPVIAVVLGAVILGERVDVQTVVAAGVMVAGVVIVVRHPARAVDGRRGALRPRAALAEPGDP